MKGADMKWEDRVMDILTDELTVSVYENSSASIERLDEAVRRIMDEIILPILEDATDD